jgi:hypothetical protein
MYGTAVTVPICTVEMWKTKFKHYFLFILISQNKKDVVNNEEKV